MSKNKIVFTIGILLIILPLTGFPPAWKSFFILAMGLTLIVLSFMVAAKRRASARRVRRQRREQVQEINTTPVHADDASVPEETDSYSSEDSDKTTFKIGYKVTQLAPNGLTAGVPLEDYVTQGATLESDNLLITDDEAEL